MKTVHEPARDIPVSRDVVMVGGGPAGLTAEIYRTDDEMNRRE